MIHWEANWKALTDPSASSGGLGGGVRQGKDTFDGDRWHTTDGNATLDFEWSLGQRWRQVALSFTQRLVWDVRWVGVLHLLSDFTLAYFPAGRLFAFTASGFFGLSITTVWAGGCGGILLML